MKKFFAVLVLSIFIFGSCNNEPVEFELQNLCEEATLNSIVAAENLANADSNEYTASCNAYKAVLLEQIDQCGDESGIIQEQIDALGNCETNTSQQSFAFMTAFFDGIQYDDMKPNFFGLLNNNAVGVVTFPNNEVNFLRIQGNNTYSSGTITNETREIVLFIPENAWQVGTYDMTNYAINPNDNEQGLTEALPHVDLNFFYEDGSSAFALETGGTLTVTEFDLELKVISGTFELPYNKTDNDGQISGPFDLTNGTFNYSLDDEFFE